MDHRMNKIALAVAAALAAAAPLHAQDATDGLEEVSVTASRIQRSGFEAPTPTTVVGEELFESRAAVRVSQVLFEIPALRPTATAVPFSAAAGGAYANLRSMNPGAPTQTATRTLVLVDGRRFTPSTATGLVDLNMIPTALVDRVEVVTGGASAAWGSDAVAGVTNFILKDKLDGFEGSVQYGQSRYSDQKETAASLAWGTGFANGRGQLMFATEYSKVSDPATVGRRDWGNDRWGWVTGSIDGRTVNRIALPGVTTSGVTYGGVIVAANGTALPVGNPLRGIQFGQGGAVQPFEYGTYLSSNLMVGGSGATLSYLANIAAPVERKNAYGKATFQFTDDIEGFVEVSYADSTAVVNTQPMYSPNGDPVFTIRRDNAYLPASVAAIMTANSIASFGMGRITPEFGTYSVGASGAETTRLAAGLDGALANGWKWSAFITSGKTDYYDKALNNVRQANLRAALDTVRDPNGNIICRINSTVAADITATTAANYQGRGAASGCVPANPFGPNSFSAEAVRYIIGSSYAYAEIEQDTAGLSLQGEPFATWAGDVSVAAGFDYRKESVSQVADPIAQVQTPAFQTGGWQFGNRKPLNGSYNVRELFAETVVPLAKDAALAHSLDLNASVRSADYSTSGSVTSWKAGLTYEPVDGLLFRGTRSKDIRAANLVELFTPGLSIVGAIVDYGRTGNPSASVPTTTLGNPDLKPEEADTTTFGVTWRPAFIEGLEASVDYYRIDLQDAIGSLGGQNIVNACYGKTPFTVADSSYCSLISRDPTSSVITNVANKNLNLAALEASGYDIELGYRFEVPALMGSGPGSLGLRLLGNRLDSLKNNNGIVTVDRAGELGNSKWRLTGTANYDSGPLSLFLQARYFGAAKIDVTYGPNDIYDNDVPSFIYLNASAQYTLRETADGGRVQLFGSINNLLDKNPPIVPSASAGAGQVPLAPDYDKIGRYFTVGLRFKH